MNAFRQLFKRRPGRGIKKGRWKKTTALYNRDLLVTMLATCGSAQALSASPGYGHASLPLRASRPELIDLSL